MTRDVIDAVIMFMIAHRPSSLKVNDLAAATGISRQSISKRVNDLATLRYINHVGQSNTITAKGEAYLASLPFELKFKEVGRNGEGVTDHDS